MPIAAVGQDIHQLAKHALMDADYSLREFTRGASEDELVEVVDGAEILGLRTKPVISERVIKAGGSLLAIGCFSSGVSHIDIPAADEEGIAVFNSQDNAQSVVEYVFTAAGMLARRIPEHMQYMASGIWSKTEAGSHELMGMTVGIVGLGAIGKIIAERAIKSEMRVVFYDPYQDGKDVEGEPTKAESLEQLLAASDVVSLNAVLTDETAGMIGPEQFEQMRDGVYFINAARMELLDVDAFADAIESDKLGGAAWDVHEDEPATNGAIFESLDGERLDALFTDGVPRNLIRTPHVGGATPEAQQKAGTGTSQRLINYVRNGAVIGSANFPTAELKPLAPNAQRVAWVHRNVAATMDVLTHPLAERGFNVANVNLQTRGEIGYGRFDVEGEVPQDIIEMAEGYEYNIRLRLIDGAEPSAT